ncbi:ABC transporter permease [Gracilibacillus sp. HCP3S3_G5_1]|uniref:ABC transporter permease n=1 Tax=unclassified Gracilibacillus TaxID=2625209 RepID=UPI003F8BFA6E
MSVLLFSGFGLFITTAVKQAQSYQIVLLAITTPITFQCGVYIPLDLLPSTLQYCSII